MSVSVQFVVGISLFVSGSTAKSQRTTRKDMFG